MTEVTLASIEAAQAELERMITELKAQAPKFTLIPESMIQLRPGEAYAGLVLREDGFLLHHLVLLPGAAEDVTWQAAKEWAASAGGELPTRQEQALLYANCKAQFESAWYWSAEEHATDGSYAWTQDFSNGGQTNYHKSYEGRARAVRRIQP